MDYFWDDWFVPAFATVTVHAVLVYLILSSAQLSTVEIIPTKIPDYIKATLVSKPVPKKAAPVSPEKIITKKPVIENLAAPEVIAEVGEYKQAESLTLDAPLEPETLLENAADMSSLLQAIEAEDDIFQDESDATEVSKYKASIRSRLQSKWSRPPSARNGMQAILNIRLVPSGEVVSVTVVKSSGSDAFDRSAANAVWLNERFSSLVGIEPRLFEEYFRDFNLLFKPEDLLL